MTFEEVMQWINNHPFIFFGCVIFVTFWIGRIVDRCEKCGSISGYDSKEIGYYYVYNCRKCGAKKEFK